MSIDVAHVTGAGGSLVSTVTLTSPTTTDGYADGADCVFPTVAAGAAITSIIIYIDAALPADQKLVAYIDTGTGLPVTPSGNDITVVWDPTNKIFHL